MEFSKESSRRSLNVGKQNVKSTIWERVCNLKSVIFSPQGGSVPVILVGCRGVCVCVWCMWWCFEFTPGTVSAG